MGVFEEGDTEGYLGINYVRHPNLGALDLIFFVETAAGLEKSTLYALRARFRDRIVSTLLGEGAAGSPADMYGITSEIFERFRGDGAVELVPIIAEAIRNVSKVSCPSSNCFMVVDRGMVSIRIVAPNGHITGREGMWERVDLEIFTADTGSYGLWVNMPITAERRWPEDTQPPSFISVDNHNDFNNFRFRMMSHLQAIYPGISSPG